MSQNRIEKPTYRVPLMTEVGQLPWNGLTVVSTFSGCGGSCLGFKMAGYKVLWANEFVPAAQATYRANHPATFLDTSDIRKVTAASIRAVIGDVEIDVYEGSPPCASFSTAGKTSKGWGQVRKYSDVEQRTDDLFEQYIRLLDELRPRAFVAENVAGMVKGVAKGFFKRYLAKMQALPYNVEAMVLDAAWLGVPQRRNRLIFIGVRKDVGRPQWPAPLGYQYSVRDAIPWITRVGEVPGGDYAKKGRDRVWNDGSEPSPTIITTLDRVPLVEGDPPNEDGVSVVPGDRGSRRRRDEGKPFSLDEPLSAVVADGARNTERAQFMVQTPSRVVEPESRLGPAVGAEWDKLKPGQQSDKYLSLILPDENAVCPTVTAIGGTGAASVAHPYERRKFTIAELRRICAFPDDFVLTGSYAQQWERLGRAVPPLMMRAVAAALVPVLRREP